MMMRICSLAMTALWLVTTAAAAAETTTSSQPHPVLTWLQEQPDASWQSDKLIVKEDLLFTTQPVKQGEELMQMSSRFLVHDGSSTACGTARVLVEEYYKDEHSTHAPYIAYLFEGFAHQSLPSAWSQPARELVQNVLVGETDLEPQEFGSAPPVSYHFACHRQDENYDEYDTEYRMDLETAYHLVHALSWTEQEIMVPVYDTLVQATVGTNHNVQLQHMDDSFALVATRDVAAGEVLIKSLHEDDPSCMHNSGMPCPSRIEYTSPLAFRDLGGGGRLVDMDAVTTWRFDEVVEELVWQVEKTKDDGYDVTWLSYSPVGSLETENILFNQWKQLQELGIEEKVQALSSEAERQAILNYHQAMSTALEQAVIAMKQAERRHQQDASCAAPTAATEQVTVHMDGTTTAAASRAATTESAASEAGATGTLYSADGGGGGGVEGGSGRHRQLCQSFDPLNPKTQVDPLNYQYMVGSGNCDFDDSRDYHRIMVDESSSRYSRLKFSHDYYPETHRWNSCLEINEWLQSCTTFRPHYHEMVVHYPASFVKDVKRVLFLGGGDVMIMHEILKYQDSLELVLGMELDQQVVRSSYRNTGIQPQFEHAVVHWAFGDATKSLLRIPKSWYGTFDVVIVDLQNFVFDTVMVADGVTIMDMAMQMVNKTHGVVARNEDFVRRRNMEFAKYVIDVELPDVPRLCQQSLTLASHGVDFLKQRPYLHLAETETLFYDPRHKHNASFWTNYRNHHDAEKDEEAESTASKAAAATASLSSKGHGVFVVMEAENVTLPLGISSLVRTKLVHTLKQLGFTEAKEQSSVTRDYDKDEDYDYGEGRRSSTSSSSVKSVRPEAAGMASIAIVLEEGYVVARTFPLLSYCALDLHLWDKFELQIPTMRALVEDALGGNFTNGSTTKYSNVALGIHGLPDAEDNAVEGSGDETLEDETTATADVTESSGASEFDTILVEMTNHLAPAAESQSAVVVLCGESSTPCQSLETLGAAEKTVVPMWTCPYLMNKTKTTSVVEDSDDSTVDAELQELMLECQDESKRVLMEVIASNKVNGLVVDSSAPHAMGQVLHKILDDDVSVLHALFDGMRFVVWDMAAQPWSEALLERIRTDMVKFNPVYHVHLSTAATTGQSISNASNQPRQVRILSAGDRDFYERLVDAKEAVQQKTGTFFHVLDGKGGVVSHVPNYQLSKLVTTTDYDLTDATKQWQSQHPLAHQTFLRGEIQLPTPILKVGDAVIYNHEEHVWYGIWFSGHITAVHPGSSDGKNKKDETTYDIMFSSGNVQRTKTNVARRLLRKFDPPQPGTTYKFGDRVLLHLTDFDGYDDVWYQASVTRTPTEVDGEYTLQIFSDEYGELAATYSDLILQMEPPDDKVHSEITVDKLMSIVEQALDWVPVPDEERQVMMGELEPEADDKVTLTRLGDGVVITALWAPGGSLVVTWDGKKRLDVDFFAAFLSEDRLNRDLETFYTKSLERVFTSNIPYLTATSIDQQPRGIGRIVNTKQELEAFWFGRLDEFLTAGAPHAFDFGSSLEGDDDDDDEGDDEDDDDDGDEEDED